MLSTSSKSALHGIRVLDLSRVLAGPWCAQILSDLGAEVIKVERPGQGDDSRAYPPFLASRDGRTPVQSSYFLSANRGKRSIEVDLSTRAGQRKIRTLVETADVLVENYKVGTLAKFGLDYKSLSAVNPRLVYCSITGYGQAGPYAHRAAYDTNIQAMGGLMSVTGGPDDLPGGGAQKVGVPITDVLTGVYAATGILAALHERATSNLGQQVDVALLDVCVASLSNVALNYLVSGKVPVHTGNAHINSAPSDAYRCKGGELLLMNVGNDRQFASFCKKAGLSNLLEDPRFSTNPLRLQNREALESQVHAALATQSRDYWFETLSEAGIPCAPINSFDEVFENPQVRAREMLIHLEHPEFGPSPAIASPIRLSRTPPTYRSAAPLLGEHNLDVDREIEAQTSPARTSSLV
jgi:crotonobetainyl-CoA:carnitine CoA-transferase CaiB-like acyl-CoA transferase